MNVVYFSPHFPDNYIEFVVQLRMKGANVLGIADAEYDNLPMRLKSALTEYYKVNNMENYDEVFRAVAYFSFKYGKIDHLDSLNEYWLMTEARLRTDFNIQGLNNININDMKYKSKKKQRFINADINVARGKVISDLQTAKDFIAEVGYPIIAKPDVGVGALNIYKIKNEDDLKTFFEKGQSTPYILEEFINGTIVSFDGLMDKTGNLVFYSSAVYQAGVMETVNDDKHFFYYTEREIPQDLEDAGRRILKEFELKGRFFHLEFFRQADNKLVALEVNMRPPGGFTTDMFNFTCDINIYEQWANMVVNNDITINLERKFFTCFISRKWRMNYRYSNEEIIQYCGNRLVFHDHIAGVFSSALGNYGYIVRCENFDDLQNYINFIHELV